MWIAPENAQQNNAADVAKELGLSRLTVATLLRQGYQKEEIQGAYFAPHLLIQTDMLPGTEEALAAFFSFIQKDQREEAEIWIYADYDVDGITSGYILKQFLSQGFAGDVHCFFPERCLGYGLNLRFCEELVHRKEKTGKDMLLITVDNGITKVEEVEYLQQNGISCIVTDHHQPQEILPPCPIIDPHTQADAPGHHLAGVGVAWKFMRELEASGFGEGADRFLYAVAFGTIADMMPMTMENIGIVRLGLYQLQTDPTLAHIQKWMEFLGIDELFPEDISWEIAPRLNAGGRMGNINAAAEIFFLQPDDEAEYIQDTLLELENINIERKKETDKAKKEMANINYGNQTVCFFNASSYTPGIIGGLAGALVNLTQKPSIVYAEVGDGQFYTGSCRSTIDILPYLEEQVVRGNLVSFGGHKEACGMTIAKDKLRDFMRELDYDIESHTIYIDPEEPLLTANVEADTVATLKEVLGQKTLREMMAFPCGKTAKILIPSVEVTKAKPSGNNPNNIKFSLDDETRKTDLWAWGMGERYKNMGEPKRIDLVVSVCRKFMNKKQMTLRVEDFQKAAL